MKKPLKKLMVLLILIFMSINLSGCNIIELIDIAIDILDSYNSSNEEEDYVYPEIDINNVNTVTDLYSGLMPSTGNAKVLVLMIEFPDYAHKAKHTKEYVQNIFFGDGSTDESLASYYKKSSYNKLNISGEVVGWYMANERSSSYERKYDEHASDMILKEALEYYYSNKLIDVNNFDGNNDGYIDAVFAVYSRRDSDISDLWWAYQTTFEDYYTKENYIQLGDKKFSNYAWASIYFSEVSFFSKGFDPTTFIHESGHLLGLDDYYDYDEYSGSNAGLGGADMMDYNVGDHLPISKLILGWTKPTVVERNESKNYKIRSFTETGDVLLIPLQEYNGIFDEYLLVEYYTPTGLNSTNTYLTKSGVRLTYVNANIGDGGMTGSYYTLFNHDNSDTDIPFTCMISPSGIIGSDESAYNKDLFQTNDTFNGKSIYYSDTLYRNFSLTVLGFNSEDSSVTISVSFN